MTLHWADLALMLAMVIAGSAVSYFLAFRRFRQTALERQRELEHRVSTLTEVIRSLEVRWMEPAAASESAAERATGSPAGKAGAEAAVQEEAIAPEIQAAIAAAAVATLGPKAQVRSAKLVPSPWSQQGRVLVHASHNLRPRG